MKRLTLDQLKPGTRLSDHLFSAHGVKLLPRGRIITPRIIERLSAQTGPFYLAATLHEVELNLAAETAARSVNAEIVPDAPDDRRVVACDCRKLSDEAMHDFERRMDAAMLTIPSVGELITPPDGTRAGVDWLDSDGIAAWRNSQLGVLQAQFDRLQTNLAVTLEPFQAVAQSQIDLYRRNPARFLQIAVPAPDMQDDYLARHALTTSCIALAAAARLKWSVRDLMLVSLAGLLHDLGMLVIPESIRRKNSRLDEHEHNWILQHPYYSLSMLARIPNVPDAVLCAAFRHHEREDARGYPRGLKAPQIGAIAQLIAVADTVSAMLSPRAYRPQRPAHESLEILIENSASGKLNRTMVRAVVEVLGAYPVGSFVRLSDTRLAVVVGVYPSTLDRPIVQYCDPDTNLPTEQIVDLAHEFKPWELSVLSGAANPAARSAA